MWCWRRLLRVTWTVRRSNQSILKEISPEYSLEGLMLKLKLQYFGHLIKRTNSLEKTLMLEKNEGRRRRGRQTMRWLDSTNDSMGMSLSKFCELVMDKDTRCAAVHRIAKSRTRLSNWTELRRVLSSPHHPWITGAAGHNTRWTFTSTQDVRGQEPAETLGGCLSFSASPRSSAVAIPPISSEPLRILRAKFSSNSSCWSPRALPRTRPHSP